MPHIAGRYYHIYNRGCNRERIFFEEENHIYLWRRVKECLPEASVSIIAYCLMPNHYHFFIRSEADDAAWRFMQRLFNGYTQAINKRYGRSGTLFEGRAKSIEVDNEPYAQYLCRYIHLNPVLGSLVKRPEQWPYSNYCEWIGSRAGSLVDREFISAFFHSPAEYEAFIRASVDEAIAAMLAKYYLE